MIDLLGRIAAEKNATPAQIALAWLLAQKPITGITKLEWLDENIGAVALELTAGYLREIDSAAAQGRRSQVPGKAGDIDRSLSNRHGKEKSRS